MHLAEVPERARRMNFGKQDHDRDRRPARPVTWYDVASRVRLRSALLTDELRRHYGELNVAVELIREAREEE